jgi:hypothetical protein
MKFKTLIPAALLLIVTHSSCKKNDVANNCEKTVASIAGTYTVVKLEIGTSGTFLDVTNLLDACQLDDKLILKTDRTSNYQDLGVVCTPSESSTGTWDINTAGKMTIATNGGAADISTADITSFDCSTLVLTGFDASSPGTQFRLTIRK